MQVHVICQKAGAAQGRLYDLLTLQREKAALLSGEGQRKGAGRTTFGNVHFPSSGILLERLLGSHSEATARHPYLTSAAVGKPSGATAPATHGERSRAVLQWQMTWWEQLGLCVRNSQDAPSRYDPAPRLEGQTGKGSYSPPLILVWPRSVRGKFSSMWWAASGEMNKE